MQVHPTHAWKTWKGWSPRQPSSAGPSTRWSSSWSITEHTNSIDPQISTAWPLDAKIGRHVGSVPRARPVHRMESLTERRHPTHDSCAGQIPPQCNQQWNEYYVSGWPLQTYSSSLLVVFPTSIGQLRQPDFRLGNIIHTHSLLPYLEAIRTC